MNEELGIKTTNYTDFRVLHEAFFGVGDCTVKCRDMPWHVRDNVLIASVFDAIGKIRVIR